MGSASNIGLLGSVVPFVRCSLSQALDRRRQTEARSKVKSKKKRVSGRPRWSVNSQVFVCATPTYFLLLKVGNAS